MKKLFGGSKQSTTQASGFAALPEELQDRYTRLTGMAEDVTLDPSQYFAPMGLTTEEQLARTLMDPYNVQEMVGLYMSPYQDIIQQDINKQFEDPAGMLAARASEAGAFGGSRMRGEQADLERSRLDAMARATADQYNQAFGQAQMGLGNLLGFGGLERGVDLAQRQALPQALQMAGDLYSPLLNTQTQTTTTKGGGLLSSLGGLGMSLATGGLGGIGSALSSGIGSMGLGGTMLGRTFGGFSGASTPSQFGNIYWR